MAEEKKGALRIVEYYAENFKKIRLVNFRPKGRMTVFTGKNAQGKTSALDAIPYVLGGKKYSPEEPMRKGATKMKVRLHLGDLIVQRTQSGLTVETAPGVKAWGTPQAMLDSLFSELSFDPIAFIGMKPAEQSKMLRDALVTDVNFEELDGLNKQDFDARREINAEARGVEGQLAGMIVLEGLPSEKFDQGPIVARMDEAKRQNAEIESVRAEKSRLGYVKQQAQTNLQNQQNKLAQLRKELDELTRAVAMQEEYTNNVLIEAGEALNAWEGFPEPTFIDLTEIFAELEKANATNREIDKAATRAQLEEKAAKLRREADALTHRMNTREEKKREAVAAAKLPIDGMTFDADGIKIKGVPLAQLGEAEQIRISVSLILAQNPRMRLVRIPHGEALDEESMAALAKLADELDFYVWMARVDSTGKVGVYLEDGEIKTNNEE